MDIRELAPILVEKALRIRENEIVEVTLTGEKRYFDFLDEFTLAISKQGAFPTIRLNSPSYRKRFLKEVPEQYLRRTPPQTMKWIKDISRHVNILADRWEINSKSISNRRRRLSYEAQKPIIEQIQQNTIATIHLPTAELAKFYRVPVRRFTETVLNGLKINYGRLRKRCRIVADHFRSIKGAIKVVTNGEFELEFQTQGRPIYVEDGSRELPGGSIYIASIETSVNGSILIDKIIYKGKTIENLLLVFENGKLVSSSADKNLSIFMNRLNQAYGDKDVFAGFGLGLNPGINDIIGCEVVDTKMNGSMHIALGSNITFGGSNFSDLFWRLVTPGAVIKNNGKTILKNGSWSI